MPFTDEQKIEIKKIVSDMPLLQVPIGTIIPYGGILLPLNSSFTEQLEIFEGLSIEDYERGILNHKGINDLGWLLCDGHAYTANYEGHPLYKLGITLGKAWGGVGIEFRVPDLRGLFLRGADPYGLRDKDFFDRTPLHNGGFDKGQVGSFQLDALKEHKHEMGIQKDGGNKDFIGRGNPTGTNNVMFTKPFGNTNETRPMNVYVNYIIKGSLGPINLPT